MENAGEGWREYKSVMSCCKSGGVPLLLPLLPLPCGVVVVVVVVVLKDIGSDIGSAWRAVRCERGRV
jgi:hypothetical protein